MRSKYLFSALALATLSACSRVPAGHRGVIVNLYGSDRGISEQSVGVGRYYLGWNKELYIFPTFLQNYAWTGKERIQVQTSEGLSIFTEAGITYKINPENVVKVFQKYRLGIDEITNTFLHNQIRDAMSQVASTLSIEDIYGPKKELFIKTVNDIVKAEAVLNGIEVEKIYLIGSFDLPQGVIDSVNDKIQATQNAMKVENEVATSRAEAQKIIVTAEARAKANKILSESLTPEFIRYQTILKWNGELPRFSGNNAVPFIDVENKK